jgi:adenosylcobinamide-GDP ribazoletransferase
VLLSGGLHLDGLADSADAWLGGFGDRERTLTIMKDPRSGPIAVVVLVLVLLLKFCALLALLATGQWRRLVDRAPLIGRSSLLAVFLTTRLCAGWGFGSGAGRSLAAHCRAGGCWGSVPWAACVDRRFHAAGLRCSAWRPSGLCVAAPGDDAIDLGGTTGDTAGALAGIARSAGAGRFGADLKLHVLL